jgi:flagellar motor switch protein FliG
LAQFGIKGALELLKRLSPKERDRLLGDVGKTDPKLASTLKSGIFVIQDLKKFSDLQWLNLMTRLSIEDIAYGLMGVTPAERVEIVKNLPEITQKKLLELASDQVIPLARLTEVRIKLIDQIERILQDV